MTKRFICFFILLFTAVEILMVSYVGYKDFLKIQYAASNTFISGNAVSVFFRDGNAPTLSDLTRTYPNQTFFLKVYNNPELQVWGICGSVHFAHIVKTFVQGRFFLEEDFAESDGKAVVGKNILNSKMCSYQANGKRYFRWNGCDYEIIGVLTSNVSSMLDNKAFINLNSLKYKFGKIIIDGGSKRSVEMTVEDLRQTYPVHVAKSDDLDYIKRDVYSERYKHVFDVMMISLIGVLIVTLAIITLRNFNEEICVHRVIGVCTKTMMLDLTKNILMMTSLTTAVVGVLYGIAYFTMLKSLQLDIHIVLMIISSGLVTATICSTMYLYVFVSNKSFHENGVR